MNACRHKQSSSALMEQTACRKDATSSRVLRGMSFSGMTSMTAQEVLRVWISRGLGLRAWLQVNIAQNTRGRRVLG